MKWKKIISLIKVFLGSFFENSKIFNGKRGKLNTKSNLFWMIVIIIIAISFISYKIINLLVQMGQPQIFLYFYFIILFILLAFQIILLGTNILFFSKELENVLPMPISSLELLLAKYGVFLITTYITEFAFGFIPLVIYGLMNMSFSYILLMPIVLILFPILIVTIVTLLTILIMRLCKFFKNKDSYQKIITLILLIVLLLFESIIMNNFSESRQQQEKIVEAEAEEQSEIIETMYHNLAKGFLIINPSVEILEKTTDFSDILLDIGTLLFYNIIAFLVLIFIGNKIYLRNILLGTSNTSIGQKEKSKKKKDKINVLKKVKQKNITRAYIAKEFKMLYRNPTFFMQMIFPVVFILISAIIIGSVIIPLIDQTIQNNENISTALKELTFNSEMLCVIFGVLQVLFSMSGISLTAISREGKNAKVLKYIPIDFYKQFLYKNVMQISLNTLISIIILGIIYFMISKITILQIILIFITSIFISLINSFLMLIVDLRRPNLNWDSEYIVVKKNDNKIFQYVFMIMMILLFLYLANILRDLKIEIIIGIHLILFAVIFSIIDLLVRKNKKKLFNKIIE